MNRRDFLKSAAMAPALTAAPRRENIIVILADDMGYADAGFNGCRDIPTPHMDAIARGGVRFSSGCVSHPFCSPTRAGLMTGRYQQRFGNENNPRYDPHNEVEGLPLTEITIAQVLREAGYATGIIGKWHLGATPSLHPMKRGFQEMFGFLGGGHDYFKAQMEGEAREYLIPIQRDGKPVVETEYLTDAFSREAAAFVRRHRADPFFLYLAYNAPHTPQQVTQKYLDRFAAIADPKRRNYAAMLSALDDGVGRVLATLQELKLDRNTLVFFLSDNGGPLGVNGARNDPWRGGKGTVCEGGIRVPFAARWPGRLPAGREFRDPVISLDIFPTAAAAAGARVPADRKIDGVNLLPYLTGKISEPPHERLFWRTGGGTSFAVREGRFKLVKTADRAELYDLEADPGESRDISPEHRDVLRRLFQACDDWNRELMPPRFIGINGPRKK